MREQRRIADSSNLGPGTHNVHKTPFGSKAKGYISMGSKHKYLTNKNPGVGSYNI